jgi:hypothetical protein
MMASFTTQLYQAQGPSQPARYDFEQIVRLPLARAMIVPPRISAHANTGDRATPALRPMGRREIYAHNRRYKARMMKTPRAR